MKKVFLSALAVIAFGTVIVPGANAAPQTTGSRQPANVGVGGIVTDFVVGKLINAGINGIGKVSSPAPKPSPSPSPSSTPGPRKP
jgi:hypothetical protein